MIILRKTEEGCITSIIIWGKTNATYMLISSEGLHNNAASEQAGSAGKSNQ